MKDYLVTVFAARNELILTDCNFEGLIVSVQSQKEAIEKGLEYASHVWPTSSGYSQAAVAHPIEDCRLKPKEEWAKPAPPLLFPV